jgi:hypothetical protein
MKRAVYAILQSLLFFVLFAIGSFLWHPFNLHWRAAELTPGVTRYFIPDGLILAVAAFFLIAIVQAIRKRLCNTPWTVIAFVVAVGAGFALKFGYVTPGAN